MRKLFLVIFVWSVTALLAGCSTISYEDITFGDFVWSAPLAALDYDIWDDSADIQAYRWDDNENSLLILSESIHSGATLEDIVDSNRETLLRAYTTISFSDEWWDTILCDDTDSYFWIFSTNTESDSQDPLYFVQYLYIYKHTVYMISNALVDDSIRNRILQSMGTIDCPR